MPPRKPGPKVGEMMDRHVGARIRMLRQMRNMSMMRLGQIINVGRQQVEKWEHGTVRLSAGQIFEVAVALETDPGWFFSEFPVGNVPTERPVEIDMAFSMPDATALLVGYSRLDRAERAAIMVLVQSLGQGRDQTVDGEKPFPVVEA